MLPMDTAGGRWSADEQLNPRAVQTVTYKSILPYLFQLVNTFFEKNEKIFRIFQNRRIFSENKYKNF